MKKIAPLEKSPSSSIDLNKIAQKVEILIKESRNKDSKIKNSIFFIKKLNEQLKSTLLEMKSKDELIKILKLEINNLEQKIRKNLIMKISVDKNKLKEKNLTEEKNRLILKLKEEKKKEFWEN